jgi:hypothetical protein
MCVLHVNSLIRLSNQCRLYVRSFVDNVVLPDNIHQATAGHDVAANVAKCFSCERIKLEHDLNYTFKDTKSVVDLQCMYQLLRAKQRNYGGKTSHNL